MPDARSQAVGVVEDGAHVFVNDRRGAWAFIQRDGGGDGSCSRAPVLGGAYAVGWHRSPFKSVEFP
jgi:hypothetical protein